MNPPLVDPSLLTGPMVRDAPRQARRTPSRSVPSGRLTSSMVADGPISASPDM